MAAEEKELAMAYWLLPERRAREFFAGEIARLAQRFGAAVFEPHVTICVLPENVVREFSPPPEILLRSEGVRTGDRFTKTLFVQFQRSSAVEELAAMIARTETPVDPHLSLLYQNLPRPARNELANEIVLPFDEVCFREICAVRCALPVESPEDVASWKRVSLQSDESFRG